MRWSYPRAQCSLWLTGGPGAHYRSLLLPLALSSSSLPRAFPGFLHRRCLARRASRPYCGSARRASCRACTHLAGQCAVGTARGFASEHRRSGDERRWWTSSTVHRSRAIKRPRCSYFNFAPGLASLSSSPRFPFTGARDEAPMAETVPDWYMILVCGGLAAVLGLSVLLCAMIFDDRRGVAARLLALRGGGDHKD